MAKTLQFRRGTTAELDANTGAEGEIFIDLDLNTIRVYDGNTLGGVALATSAEATAAYTNAISYVDSEIAAIVNSAPGVLDTLNELAEAIGDDDNFFVTVNNNINTAYSNATSYADTAAATAYSNATSYADTEITNLNLGTVSTQDANSINITGGSITIDSFVASGITYPSTDGSNGQVIATDGSGSLSFTDLPPSSDSFARTLALWGLA